jgi:hypothetical protein
VGLFCVAFLHAKFSSNITVSKSRHTKVKKKETTHKGFAQQWMNKGPCWTGK